MPNVVYLGGNCAGTISDLTDDVIALGHTSCKGTTYTFQRTGPNTVYAVAATPGETDTGDGGPGEITPGPNVLETSSALEGWNNLMHATTAVLPRGLRACSAARETIRSV